MKVYVIDNSIMIWAWIAKNASRLKGFKILGITDKADKALKELNKLEPDIIILNHIISPEDIIEIIKKIKKLKPYTRIAMLSNNTLPEFKNKCRDSGVDSLFIPIRDYYEKIREMLLNIEISNEFQRKLFKIS